MIEISELYKHFISSSGICTDTRKIESDNLFFALKGDNFDGNQYAAKALDNGACYAVVDNPEIVLDDRFILVKDSLKTLQNLATHHRLSLGIPVFSLTGSNGKTTTKELIREVLATKYKVSATEGNFNNHIGVPLTLLKMTPETEIGVVEMGANHVGEIAALSEIARPDAGLITNIGKAHLEGFGGYEGVLRGKTELYNFLIKVEGQIFINSDDAVLMNMAKRMKEPKFYNNPGDFLECEMIASSPFVKYMSEDGTVVETQLIGEYNFKNIAAALCVGKYFKIDMSKAHEAISSYVPENNRSQIKNTKRNKIILDAYNANPNSMHGALDNLAAMDHPKKIAILGDMFELGVDEALEHEALMNIAISLNLDQILVCGKASYKAANDKPGIHAFPDRAKLIEHLEFNPISNALILVKASRGMALEKVVELL
jgi:UDP-N-acetylmuramoyl-tripeptide--D-alanyl-D-alanine ligase